MPVHKSWILALWFLFSCYTIFCVGMHLGGAWAFIAGGILGAHFFALRYAAGCIAEAIERK